MDVNLKKCTLILDTPAYGYLVGAQLGERMGDVALSGVIKSSYRYCLREESQLPRCMDGSTACADPAQQYYWYSTLSDWESDRWLSACL